METSKKPRKRSPAQAMVDYYYHHHPQKENITAWYARDVKQVKDHFKGTLEDWKAICEAGWNHPDPFISKWARYSIVSLLKQAHVLKGEIDARKFVTDVYHQAEILAKKLRWNVK